MCVLAPLKIHCQARPGFPPFLPSAVWQLLLRVFPSESEEHEYWT